MIGPDGPAGLLPGFGGLEVAVIGEAILDSYLEGSAGRLSREAPVPIVEVTARTDAPGGAANTAVNLAALGARVRFLSVLGDDSDGDRVWSSLQAAGVDTGGVIRQAGRSTLAKQRVAAGGHMLLRFDSGTTEAPDAATEDELIASLAEAYRTADAVVVSDYGYGVLSERVVAVLGELQRARPAVLVVDARDLRRYRGTGATAVKPNYGEACRLLGLDELRDKRARTTQIGMEGERLLETTRASIVAVTVDTEGAFVFERDEPPYRTYATPRPHSRAAGAGDTFVAALTLALASGAAAPEAAELASVAASVVVEHEGTSVCAAADLAVALSLASGKRLDRGPGLDDHLASLRAGGRRIVFTNGVFDILHRGHVTYLARAKALGDVLIVGVNSDASVRRLKGPKRPINALDDRLAVLEALSPVDLVVPFEEDTPEALIADVRPEVFVKGGDYRIEDLPEAPLVEALGGTVRILPFTEDRSTTNVIARVRAAYGVPVGPGAGAAGPGARPGVSAGARPGASAG